MPTAALELEDELAVGPAGTREPLPPVLRWLRVAFVVVVAVDLVPATTRLAWLVMALGAIATTVWSIVRYRPTRQWIWWAIVGALSLFTAGGVATELLHTFANLSPRRSILPDEILVPGYVLLGTALGGFVIARTQHTHRRLSTICDGLIAGLALLACTWDYIIQPVLSRHLTPSSLRLVIASYPAISLAIAVTTLQIVLNAERRHTPAERFLLTAMAAMFTGALLHMLVELHVLVAPARYIELPYLIAFAAAGRCTLDPSMRAITERCDEEELVWTPGRILLVAVAFTVPALLVLQTNSFPFRQRLILFAIVIALTSTGIFQLLQALHAVERSEVRLRQQALHDGLTGLPNRRLLEDHLSDLLARYLGRRGAVGLLFLDLDRFKLINDTLGHSHGDDLLMQVARRLQSCVRERDLVARIGGDEFLVVLDDPSSLEEARDTANRLRTSLHAPFFIAGTEFFVSTSIGLSYSGRRSGVDVEMLIREADTAMYQAKEGGRDAVAVFDDSMRDEIEARVEIEHELRHAIDRAELHLVYQPVLSLANRHLVGFEALVRWAHPTLGVILPNRFIPLAEESGLIVPIGNWVLEEGLRQLAVCRREFNNGELTMAVNVSAAQLRDEHLVERVRTALLRHGLPGSALCVELTETEMMRDPNTAIAALTALRRLDVRVAIDDFGTAYSSLAYLQRLPVDILKIDCSFVSGLKDAGGASESLVTAIMAMARALSIETIAEGVELASQADCLSRLGCDMVQGYLYSRPVSADQLASLIVLLRLGELASNESPRRHGVPLLSTEALAG